MQVLIYVASHKQIEMDLPDCYKICQVNAHKNGRWGGDYVYDDEGINISEKNESYCELTALYSLWKNSDADIKGLVHYRRFFVDTDLYSLRDRSRDVVFEKELNKEILKKRMIEGFLQNADVIIETPRNPQIVNAYEDLTRFVFEKDIEILSSVIIENHSNFLDAYNSVLHASHISYLNMMIAPKKIFDSYCEWIFDVLKKVEKRIDISDYDPQHRRIFGYMAEVLLNVWILKNNLRVRYTDVRQLPSDDYKKNGIKYLLKNAFPRLYINRNIIRKEKYEFIKNHVNKSIKDICSCSLDDVYSKFFTIEDVKKYITEHMDIMIDNINNLDNRVKLVIGIRDYGNTYSYAPSNKRCIVNIIGNDVGAIKKTVFQVDAMYKENYTVSYRILTNNPKVNQWVKEKTSGYCFLTDKKLLMVNS